MLAPRTWSEVLVLARELAAEIPEPTDGASGKANEEQENEDLKGTRNPEPRRDERDEQDWHANPPNKVEHED